MPQASSSQEIEIGVGKDPKGNVCIAFETGKLTIDPRTARDIAIEILEILGKTGTDA